MTCPGSFPNQTGDTLFDAMTAVTREVIDALEQVTAERNRLRAENARLVTELRWAEAEIERQCRRDNCLMPDWTAEGLVRIRAALAKAGA